MNPVAGKTMRRIGAIVFSAVLISALFGGLSKGVHAQPDAAFQPPHSDFGLDTNTDGLYDYLVVDVVFNVSVSAYYRIFASLADMFWNMCDDHENYTFLDAGIQTVQFRFEGVSINKNGVDGPYTVFLTLYDSARTYLDSDTHATALYNWTDFPKPASFEPPHSDYGLDTDSDGKFDFLVVDVAVYVLEPADYSIQAYVLDGSWNSIEWDCNTSFLEEGIQTVELRFYGISINNNGIDGPYTVNMMLQQDLSAAIYSDTHVTSAYNSTDFQSGTHFEPPDADYGLDTDSDGLYNYLVVEVIINVTSAGDHMIDAILYDDLISTCLGMDTRVMFLDPGMHTVEFRFCGMAINFSGEDGPYLVNLVMTDFTYNQIDWDTHLTSAYSSTDFQTPPKFEPPHSDHGLDTDSDTLFNYLVVDIVVNVSIPDNYFIQADLYDNNSGLMDSSTNYTFLNVGIQMVEFLYDGMSINTNVVDGPYDVQLSFYDVNHFLLDWGSYTTSAYNWTDFDPPPGFEPPHSDFGLDTDSDGLYNYLVIEAVVNLSSPAYYRISAFLYDVDGRYVTDWNNETYLDCGVQTVEVRFSGMRINNYESNGPYSVEMNLVEEDSLLDSDTHLTAAYNWTDFQTGTVFEPYHTDRGLDTDSDGLFDYVILEVVVNVSLACDYEIFTHLYDAHKNWIDVDWNYTFRSVGVQVVEFRFDGASISENGVDGPYTAFLYLLEGASGVALDADTYYTFSYNLTDFPDLTVPVADAGEDRSVNEDTNFAFDGTGSEDNVGIANYSWSFVDVTAKDLYGANPVYNFTQPGIYLVTLNVWDAAGNWDNDTVNVTVVDVTPPVADAGPDVFSDISTAKVLDGSRSTDNVEIVNYTWTFVDGALQTLFGMTPSYTFTTLGQYNVTLSVQDAAGNADTDNLMVTAIVDVDPPIADAGADRTVDEDTTIIFDGSGSSDNVDIANYKWTFDDGGIRTLSGVNPTHKFATPGTYNVTLVVTDVVDLSASDTVVFIVNDTTPPMADAGFDATVRPGALVTFNGSASSDNVAVVNYTWTIVVGDETVFLYGISPVYEFDDIGVYEVALTVRDAANKTGADTVIITVEDVARASFIEDYWWAILILIAGVAIPIAVYLLVKNGRGKEKQPAVIEQDPSIPKEKEPPPGPVNEGSE